MRDPHAREPDLRRLQRDADPVPRARRARPLADSRTDRRSARPRSAERRVRARATASATRRRSARSRSPRPRPSAGGPGRRPARGTSRRAGAGPAGPRSCSAAASRPGRGRTLTRNDEPPPPKRRFTVRVAAIVPFAATSRNVRAPVVPLATSTDPPAAGRSWLGNVPLPRSMRAAGAERGVERARRGVADELLEARADERRRRAERPAVQHDGAVVAARASRSPTPAARGSASRPRTPDRARRWTSGASAGSVTACRRTPDPRSRSSRPARTRR